MFKHIYSTSNRTGLISADAHVQHNIKSSIFHSFELLLSAGSLINLKHAKYSHLWKTSARARFRRLKNEIPPRYIRLADLTTSAHQKTSVTAWRGNFTCETNLLVNPEDLGLSHRLGLPSSNPRVKGFREVADSSYQRKIHGCSISTDELPGGVYWTSCPGGSTSCWVSSVSSRIAAWTSAAEPGPSGPRPHMGSPSEPLQQWTRSKTAVRCKLSLHCHRLRQATTNKQWGRSSISILLLLPHMSSIVQSNRYIHTRERKREIEGREMDREKGLRGKRGGNSSAYRTHHISHARCSFLAALTLTQVHYLVQINYCMYLFWAIYHLTGWTAYPWYNESHWKYKKHFTND